MHFSLRTSRALLAALAMVMPGAALGEPVSLSITPIDSFSADGRTRFDALDYLGGFSFSSGWGRVEGISAFRYRDEEGGRFLAVSDTGSWFAGVVTRDEDDRPIGFSGTEIHPLSDPEAAPIGGKFEADAEALALTDSQAIIAFERDHRIWAYPRSPAPFGTGAIPLPLPIPRHELRSNQGIEALAIAPEGSALAGSMVAIAEGSIDPAGNLLAAIIEGDESAPMTVRLTEEYDISDAVFLPDGDLLVLERRYRGPVGGLDIRIRRMAGAAIVPGALLDGPVVFHADLGQEIDNMEAIDIWVTPSGETRLTLVSDDNGSLLQRQLLLEFRLVDDAA